MKRAVVAALLVVLPGASAYAQTTTVTASWESNYDSTTAGYVLSYGTSPGSYQWTLDAGNQTSAQITLNQGSRYYFIVRAYTASAVLSAPSNESSIDLSGSTATAPTATITASLQNATTALVTWSTTNATSATINGSAVALSGSTTVPVSATTTFTLVATGAGGTTTRSATVTVSQPAPTATITASLQNATTALVTWSTTNATSATINGAAVGLSGSTTVPVSATTTFTLVATGAGGTTTRSATVTVSQPAPTATVTASLQNTTTALVTWSTANATSVTINGIAVGLSGSTSVAVSSGTTTFTLVATGAGGTVTRSASVTATQPVPTASIRASLQNPTTALVSWSTTNATSATINGLGVGLSGSTSVPVSTTTTFTLVAAGTGGTASASATVTLSTTANEAPGAPSTMMASVSRSRVTLTWRPSTSGPAPTHYLLDVGTSWGGTDVARGFNVGNVLRVSADLPRGRYYARVRAANGAGVSGYSNIASFKIGRSLISPKGFTVEWVGTEAVLRWSQPAGDGTNGSEPTSFVIEAGTAPGLADVGTIDVGPTTSFRTKVPAGRFFVRVKAVNDEGESEPTTDLELVPAGTPAAPGAPGRLVATGSSVSLTLRWQAPSGGGPVTGYQLEAGSSPGASDVSVIQTGTVTSYYTPLPKGTYYVRVRALNAGGVGAASNEVIVRR
ncbi:MAG: fibronectin type III domain-containing protein [Vicinamibacterales bacterium]